MGFVLVGVVIGVGVYVLLSLVVLVDVYGLGWVFVIDVVSFICLLVLLVLVCL